VKEKEDDIGHPLTPSPSIQMSVRANETAVMGQQKNERERKGKK